jgi:hypothetical protein
LEGVGGLAEDEGGNVSILGHEAEQLLQTGNALHIVPALAPDDLGQESFILRPIEERRVEGDHIFVNTGGKGSSVLEIGVSEGLLAQQLRQPEDPLKLNHLDSVIHLHELLHRLEVSDSLGDGGLLDLPEEDFADLSGGVLVIKA